MTTTLGVPSDAPAAPAPSPSRAPRGGTRWRRSLVLLLPGLAMAAALALATLNGVLPVNLAVSGQDFKISSNGQPIRTPQGLTMYPATIRMKNGGRTRGVVIAGLPEAVLTEGMCLSLVLTFPVVGSWTVRLHTSGTTTVTKMTLDASGLVAGPTVLVPRTSDGRPGTGANLVMPAVIGQDASDLGGPRGRFAIDAPGGGSLHALRADAEGAVIAGTLDVDGLSVEVHHGRGVRNGECF